MADSTVGGQNQEAVIGGVAPQELDGKGTPVWNNDTEGTDVSLGADHALFTNKTAPKDMSLGGTGDPAANNDNQGPDVNYGSSYAISNNATSPKEEHLGGRGKVDNNDNVGTDVAYGAKAAIFNNKTSPTESLVDGAVLEEFDNKGKNVYEFRDPGPPVDTSKTVTYTGRVLNFDK